MRLVAVLPSPAAQWTTTARHLSTSATLRCTASGESSGGPLRYVSQAKHAGALRVKMLEEELLAARNDAISARLQLGQVLQSPLPRLCAEMLNRLQQADRQAHADATALRYTGMALQTSHDTLEVELRRLLAIGLTSDEIDAAAIEAGARQYVRSNIGFRPERVSDESAGLTVCSQPTVQQATPNASSPAAQM